MIRILKAGLVLGALALAPLALAEEAVAPAVDAAAAAAPAADAATGEPGKVVTLTAAGEQAVLVDTGNDTVDAAANYASKCAERTAAMKACDTMGSFKAIGCRKLAEMRYKSVNNCPNL